MSEDVLVDWIDGRLTPEQEREAARASGRPDLASRIAAMRAQRDVLRALPHAQAPSDLHDRVMAAVERDVLLGIADGVNVQPVEGRFRTNMASDGVVARIGRAAARHTPRLALAAGLLLLMGGLAYFSSVVWKSMNGPLAKTGQGSITSNGGGVTNITPDLGADRTLADNRAGASDWAGGRDSSDATAAAVKASPAADEQLAAATLSEHDGGFSDVELASGSGRRVVPIEEVERLAREGRVVVRVLAQKPEELARIEPRLIRPDAQRAWRLTREVPARIAAAVLPAPAASPAREGVMASASQPRTMASLLGPYLGPAASMTMLTASPDASLARVRGTYFVDVPLAPRALTSVATVFRSRLDAKVLFEELPESLDLPSPARAREVAWWTLGPNQWVERVYVPLVVEAR